MILFEGTIRIAGKNGECGWTDKRPARRRGRLCGRVFLVVAAFLATGLTWDFLQFAAWGGMYWQNLHGMDATEAFSRTFSEEGRCNVCKTIEKARQGDPETPLPVAWGARAWLLPLSFEKCLVRPPNARQMQTLAAYTAVIGRSEPPPVPPPKK